MRVEKSRYFNPVNNVSVVDRVVNDIINAILSKELKPGDKLPTEYELSKIFNVSRNSIREAVKILVAYGILIIRRPDGTFIATEITDRMVNSTVYWLLFENSESKDIVELRRCIEIGTVEILISKINEKSISELENNIKKMHEVIDAHPFDIDECVNLDIQFHELLFKNTENIFVRKIGRIVSSLTYNSLHQVTEWANESGHLKKIVGTHEALLSVIKNKQYDRISEVVRENYKLWENI